MIKALYSSLRSILGKGFSEEDRTTTAELIRRVVHVHTAHAAGSDPRFDPWTELQMIGAAYNLLSVWPREFEEAARSQGYDCARLKAFVLEARAAILSTIDTARGDENHATIEELFKANNARLRSEWTVRSAACENGLRHWAPLLRTREEVRELHRRVEIHREVLRTSGEPLQYGPAVDMTWSED